MKIKKIEEIESKPSRCISVDSPDKLFEVYTSSGLSVLTRNSVVQRNILNTAVLRKDKWVVMGIDLKRVEITQMRKYGMYVASELEEALQVLRFASTVMMTRYNKMEAAGVNNYEDLAQDGKALMVMVDELAELTGILKGSSDEIKESNELKNEAIFLIGSIARLGRAAHVHLVLALQRPDVVYLGGGEVRANMTTRIACGRMNPTASSMLLDNNEGARIKGNPKGRVYIQTHGIGNHGQGFYADESWLEDYLSSHHIETDASSSKKMEIDGEQIQESETTKSRDHLKDWDDDMEEIYNAKK